MTTPAEWRIRDARKDDTGAVVELLRAALGEGSVPRSEAFWRWKHRDNPFGESPVLVAEVDGRLVAVRAFLRWAWQYGEPGDGVAAVRAVDTATHPDWRGRGLFTELTRRLAEREAARGTAFVFNTPNRKSGPGYRKLGWRPAGRLPVLVRPLRLGALSNLVPHLLREWRRDGGHDDTGGAGENAAADSTPWADLAGVGELLDRAATGDLVERLITAGGDDDGQPRYRTVPTLPYLRWRYADPPGLDYRALWAGEGDSAAAVVLRRRRRRGLVEISVSEVLAAPGAAGSQTAAALLGELSHRTGGDHAVAIASPHTPERSALRDAGFLPVPAAGPRLFVRPLAGTTPLRPGELTNWRWTTGAAELF